MTRRQSFLERLLGQAQQAADRLPVDASDAPSFEIDDVVGIGDDVVLYGSNRVTYEGICLNIDEVEGKLLARVWDCEVRSYYTAWWGIHHLIEVNGEALEAFAASAY